MNAGAPAPRRLPLARAAFLAYALVLLVATHWPRLRIGGPVERPDLWLHMLAFGLWTALLALSGLAGPRWSVRGVVASVGLGLAYAALDEASQAIPALGRTAALDDYLADAAGILLAGALLLVVSWRRDLRRRYNVAPVSESVTNPDAGAGLGRAVRTVSALTLVSRVMGLARDLATVRIFGDTAVGSAFAAAFAIPNMFRRLFGEGALSAAFLPEYARLDEHDPDSAGAFARLTLLMLALVTGALAVVIELGVLAAILLTPVDADRDLSFRLIMVMIPYMPLVCIAAIMGGMLQAHGRFGVWAAAPIILNVFVIGACAPYWAVQDATPALWAYIIGVVAVAAGAVQVVWSWAALRGRVRWGAHSAEAGRRVRAMLVRMVPVLVGLGTLQLNSLVDTLVAMWPVWVGPEIAGRAYPLDQASNAVLYYAQRLYQFPLGVFGVAVATAVFPALSRATADEGRFLDTLRKGVRLSLFIALPASVGLALVREDLVGALYSGLGDGFSDEGVARAGWVVLGYSVGVWAYSLNQIWTRAFYARGDTGTPMRIAVAMVGLNLALNLVLIWRLREAGLAWGTSIAAITQCALLGLAARRKLGVRADAGLRRSIGRTALMAGVMGLCVGAVLALWPDASGWGGRALRLGVATVGGAGVFGALALVLRAPELSWLLHPRGGASKEA